MSLVGGSLYGNTTRIFHHGCPFFDGCQPIVGYVMAHRISAVLGVACNLLDDDLLLVVEPGEPHSDWVTEYGWALVFASGRVGFGTRSFVDVAAEPALEKFNGHSVSPF